MSDKGIYLLSIRVSLLRYFIILISLLLLQKVQSNSEIHLTVYNVEGKFNRRIIGNEFYRTPSEVIVNGENRGSSKFAELEFGYNNVTIKFGENINTCADMFRGLYGIEEITIKSFINLKPVSMNHMFAYCDIYMKKIIFKNIDTSEVTDMNNLFFKSTALEEIDLSEFNTASVTSMNQMFSYCENIKVIDASSFDTSKVTSMFDMFGYCSNVVYLDLSSFNTQNVKVFQGMFISCSQLKYLDIGHFDFSSIKNSNGNNKEDRFHYTFANNVNLICYNLLSFFINDIICDFTFENTNGNKKFCITPGNIQTSPYKLTMANSCDEPCFTDMKTKKFDVSGNYYTDNCDDSKYEYKNLCWADCPYNYYRIYTDRKRCSKEKPGETFYYDESDKTYKQCFETCKKCSSGGDESNHNCDECAVNFEFITDDIYANSKNCYEKCSKYYYFTENNKHFCTEQCPDNFKLISEKNKCIDSCSNDDTVYKLELDNTCVTQCPKGTFQKESNKCEHCYDSFGECTSVGDDSDHILILNYLIMVIVIKNVQIIIILMIIMNIYA